MFSNFKLVVFTHHPMRFIDAVRNVPKVRENSRRLPEHDFPFRKIAVARTPTGSVTTVCEKITHGIPSHSRGK